MEARRAPDHEAQSFARALVDKEAFRRLLVEIPDLEESTAEKIVAEVSGLEFVSVIFSEEALWNLCCSVQVPFADYVKVARVWQKFRKNWQATEGGAVPPSGSAFAAGAPVSSFAPPARAADRFALAQDPVPNVVRIYCQSKGHVNTYRLVFQRALPCRYDALLREAAIEQFEGCGIEDLQVSALPIMVYPLQKIELKPKDELRAFGPVGTVTSPVTLFVSRISYSAYFLCKSLTTNSRRDVHLLMHDHEVGGHIVRLEDGRLNVTVRSPTRDRIVSFLSDMEGRRENFQFSEAGGAVMDCPADSLPDAVEVFNLNIDESAVCQIAIIKRLSPASYNITARSVPPRTDRRDGVPASIEYTDETSSSHSPSISSSCN